MDISSITATVLFLVAGDRRLLTDGFVAVKSIAVPSHEHAARWREIDEAEWVEPKQAAISEEVRQATAAIINRIAAVVVKYNAIEDVKAIEDINIESLLALAAEKGVTDEDMAALKGDIVMLKTDLEGKMDANWYGIWNGWLKGAIADAMHHIEEALQATAVADSPQEPTETTSEELTEPTEEAEGEQP